MVGACGPRLTSLLSGCDVRPAFAPDSDWTTAASSLPEGPRCAHQPCESQRARWQWAGRPPDARPSLQRQSTRHNHAGLHPAHGYTRGGVGAKALRTCCSTEISRRTTAAACVTGRSDSGLSDAVERHRSLLRRQRLHVSRSRHGGRICANGRTEVRRCYLQRT